jgi:hypothetical protein
MEGHERFRMNLEIASEDAPVAQHYSHSQPARDREPTVLIRKRRRWKIEKHNAWNRVRFAGGALRSREARDSVACPESGVGDWSQSRETFTTESRRKAKAAKTNPLPFFSVTL